MTDDDVTLLAADQHVEARFSFGLNVLSYRGVVDMITTNYVKLYWNRDRGYDILDKRSPLWRLIKVVK